MHRSGESPAPKRALLDEDVVTEPRPAASTLARDALERAVSREHNRKISCELHIEPSALEGELPLAAE